MISDAMQGLLEQAGIRVDGANPWDIQVRDARLYARLWREKSLGLGESYMDGWWDCPRVDELVCRLLRGRIPFKGHPRMADTDDQARRGADAAGLQAGR